MAIESGIGWQNFTVDDSGGTARDLVSGVLNVDWDISRETIDSTGLDKSSNERLVGLGDFSINFAAAYDDAANNVYAVLSTVGTTDVARSILAKISDQVLGLTATGVETWITSSSLTRGEDASLQYAVTAVLEDGADIGWNQS